MSSSPAWPPGGRPCRRRHAVDPPGGGRRAGEACRGGLTLKGRRRRLLLHTQLFEPGARHRAARGGQSLPMQPWRMAHAARSRRWRIRHHRLDPLATTQVEADANIVTHQGSPGSPADAPLLAWTSDRAEASLTCEPDPGAAKAVARSTGPTCRRCGAALAPWVRQGFLRRPAGVRAARHDHSP